MSQKILLGMSGGVDSSVAAILLKEKGYIVHGITMKIWDFTQPNKILNEAEIERTKKLAQHYNIPLKIVDVKEQFQQKVVNYFVENYLSGFTPNPCVMCNRTIKWNELWKAFDGDFDMYATGHYAQIKEKDGRYFISEAVDKQKDQSYFLWQLTQEQLKKTLFPLGALTKNEIRAKAEIEGFTSLSKQKESQEVCFLAGTDYRNFVKKFLPESENKIVGDFIWLKTGKKVGTHEGFFNYTIGQRRGLNIALGKPVYVVKIDSQNNIVYLGDEEDLMSKIMFVKNINLQKYTEIKDGTKVKTRIRYRSKGFNSRIYQESNDLFRIEFEEPVKSITPGQSAVFYEGEDIVGGGIIAK
jgi:tRNA-specific 2-thiouridylase